MSDLPSAEQHGDKPRLSNCPWSFSEENLLFLPTLKRQPLKYVFTCEQTLHMQRHKKNLQRKSILLVDFIQ